MESGRLGNALICLTARSGLCPAFQKQSVAISISPTNPSPSVKVAEATRLAHKLQTWCNKGSVLQRPYNLSHLYLSRQIPQYCNPQLTCNISSNGDEPRRPPSLSTVIVLVLIDCLFQNALPPFFYQKPNVTPEVRYVTYYRCKYMYKVQDFNIIVRIRTIR